MIVDGRMPNLDGWKFIVQARAGGYKGRIIVFSAYLDEDELGVIASSISTADREASAQR